MKIHQILQSSARFYLVANTLPFEISLVDGKPIVKGSAGGLVTALAPLMCKQGGSWVGWPKCTDVDENEVRQLIAQKEAESGFHYIPVMLSKEEVDLYYRGCTNEILWPLFHDLLGECSFEPAFWHSYEKVNAKFAAAIPNGSAQADFIWVHDYHLMLVGQELKKLGRHSKIGFFLHTPFPPMDIFLKLPWRFQVLRGLLSYDIVGFQTARDTRNFIHCIKALSKNVKVTMMEKGLHRCKVDGTETVVGSFPISIDYHDFSTDARSAKIAQAAGEWHQKWPEQKLVLSIDRLDYTKGIPYRLKAIQTFLKMFPEWHKKVSFIQVVIPSRTGVPQYQHLKGEIDRLVGEINSEYTQENWVPINYLYRSLSRTELLSYYRAADIALVTPLKDGMNMVCKEYIACSIDHKGVLILSEFAGAAAQLQIGALMINPCDIEGMAIALESALTMEKKEIERRNKALCKQIKKCDLYWWLTMFLTTAFGKDLHDFPDIQEFVPQEQ